MQLHSNGRARVAGAGFVAAIVVGSFVCSLYSGCQRGNRVPKSEHVAECRVSYCDNPGCAIAEVFFDDQSLIDNLVLQPMRNATRDPEPAAYAVTGTLTITSPDESRETLVLFSPWGHYSRGDEYFVADLSGLQTACEEALRNAQHRMDVERATWGKDKTDDTQRD